MAGPPDNTMSSTQTGFQRNYPPPGLRCHWDSRRLSHASPFFLLLKSHVHSLLGRYPPDSSLQILAWLGVKVLATGSASTANWISCLPTAVWCFSLWDYKVCWITFYWTCLRLVFWRDKENTDVYFSNREVGIGRLGFRSRYMLDPSTFYFQTEYLSKARTSSCCIQSHFCPCTKLKSITNPINAIVVRTQFKVI